ncbi:unnamed protein product [Owenia fusiformis]|uniref:EGF-like domain-containing protein n=1 Tax=Owenia fusiformis TaxID=6347 RepID=A0A8S4P4A9_OWEFU|nr:unnamed protein product [Owenia fusiformis]
MDKFTIFLFLIYISTLDALDLSGRNVCSEDCIPNTNSSAIPVPFEAYHYPKAWRVDRYRGKMTTCFRCCHGWQQTDEKNCDKAVPYTYTKKEASSFLKHRSRRQLTSKISCLIETCREFDVNHGRHEPWGEEQAMRRCGKEIYGEKWHSACLENPCGKKPCQNGGTCYPDATPGHDYFCECMPRCAHEYGSYKAFINNGTSCDAKCSWSSNLCFPGTCLGTVSTCSCSSGFSGTHCLKIGSQHQPLFPKCEAALKRLVDGQEKDTIRIECLGSTEAVYTNIPSLNHIEVHWKTFFHQPKFPTFPNYIKGIRLGITSSSGSVIHTRGSSTLTSLKDAFPCNAGSSQSPRIDTVECNPNVNINWNFQHNDKITFSASATNGGYLEYYSPETSGNHFKYYSSQTSTNISVFIFDFVNPYHCSEKVPACTIKVMDFGEEIRKTGLTLRWDGWMDDLSGIIEYDYAIYFTRLDKSVLVESHPAVKSGDYQERDIDPFYDDNEGTRTILEIPNANAIVKFQYAFAKDHKGGRTLTSKPSMWIDTDDILDQGQILDLPRIDGDSFRIWLKAIDVMGTEIDDDIYLHIDSSPGLIDDVWLVSNGREELTVHGLRELYDIRFRFKAFDIHSGLHTVHWRLFDNFTNTEVVLGESYTHVIKKGLTDDCNGDPDCYCTPAGTCYGIQYEVQPDFNDFPEPIGTHDHDYYLRITVTNIAQLVQTFILKISIDTSPPHTGIVYDGLAGNPEIDFQQDFTIHAGWTGFFDRESGVRFYQYGFSNSCLGEEMFTLINSSDVTETQNTDASITLNQTGTYFWTVVAYNSAMEPSAPVCSDGITIDGTPPIVHSIAIDNIRTRPGYVTKGNVTWLINTRGRKIKLNGTACSGSPIPDETVFADTYSEVLTECDEGHFIQRFYLTQEKELNVNWTGIDDESGIFDFEVGLSSTDSTMAPDLSPFRSTNQRQSWKMYHPPLSEGELIYVIVKATNRARMSTMKVFGPLIVDITGPHFDGALGVSIVDEYVSVSWDPLLVYDNEDMDKLLYEFAIGSYSHHQDRVAFRPIQAGPNCDIAYRNCTEIQLSELGLEPAHPQTFLVSLKIVNSAGLSTIVVAEPYTYTMQPPNIGIVKDILPMSESEAVTKIRHYDIDHQISATSIHGEWSGFAHSHLPVTYAFGVGTAKGLDDVVAFTEVNGTSFEATGLAMLSLQTYYVTVIAKTKTGSVNASSDGVTVIPDNFTVDAVIHDGLGCVSFPIKTDHHTAQAPCKEDVDFQSSHTEISAHWQIPAAMARYITHAHYRLEQYETSSQSWIQVLPDRDLKPIRNNITITNLELDVRSTYRSVLSLCSPALCFSPITTDGVIIYNARPKPGSIHLQIKNSTLDVAMEDFDAGVYGNTSLMNYYEWTFSTDVESHGILIPWQLVDGIKSNQVVSFSLTLPSSLMLNRTMSTKCWKLCIRGWSFSGLWTVLCTDIVDCDELDTNRIHDMVVFDIQGPVEFNKHQFWENGDADYTASRDTLSAAWPSLRHGSYTWAIIAPAIDNLENSFDARAALDGLCDHSDTILCGETNDEHINVFNLTLQSGRRYFVCVSANKTAVGYERFIANKDSMQACSDGITTDWTSPDPGEVTVMGNKDAMNQWYQSSITDIEVFWTSFIDEEEAPDSPNHHGLKFYQIAVGGHRYGVDVLNYTTVGVTNHHRLTGLNLTRGHEYFISIKGTNFVGLSGVSSSHPVIIDDTPPLLTKVAHVRIREPVVRTRHVIDASWDNVFVDAESDISHYLWAIGSKEGLADIHGPYHTVYTGINKAGLHTTTSSHAFIVDSTAPNPGYIYDGKTSTTDILYRDLDYQTDASRICAHWEGFVDPHTDIAEHILDVGTCSGCDDLVKAYNVGLKTEVCIDYMQLSQGKRYFSTLTTCNQAGLCVSRSSDGVTIDSSPPVAGIVEDGTLPGDVQFQASRNYISAHWSGFHDAHSGLSHYEFRAGTTPGGDNIVSPVSVHLTDLIVFPLDTPLPLTTKLFSTIRAFNYAGQWTDAVTNSFTVDITPPVIVTQPHIKTNLGPTKDNFQIWKSSLVVEWEFADFESEIERQYVSIYTHHDGDNTSPTTDVGTRQHFIFTNLTLVDGSNYYVTVISCNKAKLCSESTSEPILIDSSRSSVGTFASWTNHAAELMRHQTGYMTWNESSITLQWLGFEDHHSGIDRYMVTVGRTFAGHEYTKAQPVVIPHAMKGTIHVEGVIQEATILLDSSLTQNENIYVKMWAVNKVGLPSLVVHNAFNVVPSGISHGILLLVRRCDTHSCEGDCVCAPQNQVCDTSKTCIEAAKGENHVVEIDDIQDISFLEQSSQTPGDIDVTNSDCLLAATWCVNKTNGKPIKRFEYSAGVEGEYYGSGVFDPAHDRIWYEAGYYNHAVVTPTVDRLLQGHRYVFYIRAWYDDSTYTVFQSDGIVIDITPSIVSRIRHIQESDDENVPYDKDYTNSHDTVAVDWLDVFSDKESGLSHFIVGIGTKPRVDDAYTFTIHTGTSAIITGLELEPSQQYYSTVIAVSNGGLETAKVSDGFMVDIELPSAGFVIDGNGLHDSDYSNQTRELIAQWHGFYDRHSGISRYIVCVGTSPSVSDCDVYPAKSLGLQTSIVMRPSEELKHGLTYYTKVYAIDAADLSSFMSVSDGISIDTTPPDIMQIAESGENLLRNPSFEDGESVFSVYDNATLWINSADSAPIYWEIEDGSKAAVISSENNEFKNGRKACFLLGTLKQSFNTAAGKIYALRFFVSHPPYSSIRHVIQNGQIQAPGIHETFRVYPRQEMSLINNGNPNVHMSNGSNIAWHKHMYTFRATEATSTIVLQTLEDNSGLLFDDVLVEEITHASSDGTIQVTYQQINEWSSIHAQWEAVDIESPIVDISWAIGLVQGGTQLQPFTSVGRRGYGINSKLQLIDGMEVYVTVLFRNAADLMSVYNAEPIVVDHTPPVITHVYDGNSTRDTEYQQSGQTLFANWRVEDQQVSLDHCEIAFGLKPGLDDIVRFSQVGPVYEEPHMVFKSDNLHVEHGTTVYTTVRCFNARGLWLQSSSNGVTVLSKPPDNTEASISLVTNSSSQHRLHDGFLNDPRIIGVKWGGFKETCANEIKSYEIHIHAEGNAETLSTYLVNAESGNQIIFNSLNLQQHKQYQIRVLAVNQLGVQSGEVSTSFITEFHSPNITGTAVTHSWLDEHTARLSWIRVFSADSALYYELTIGTTPGGTDIMKWIETEQNGLTLYALDNSLEYYASITGINQAGFFQPVSYTFSFDEFV